MNRKVFIANLVLAIVFLTGMYVIKMFYPQEFVMCIENERLIQIGNYIDTHKWAFYVFGIITSFVTYWLYCCACCQKKYLSFEENIIIFGIILGSILINLINVELVGLYSVVSMLMLPIMFKGNAKYTIITYCTHYTAQWLTLRIRNFPTFMTSINSLSLFITNLECIGWLIVFYLIFNYKEKEA